jgi:hypothetical protein
VAVRSRGAWQTPRSCSDCEEESRDAFEVVRFAMTMCEDSKFRIKLESLRNVLDKAARPSP